VPQNDLRLRFEHPSRKISDVAAPLRDANDGQAPVTHSVTHPAKVSGSPSIEEITGMTVPAHFISLRRTYLAQMSYGKFMSVANTARVARALKLALSNIEMNSSIRFLLVGTLLGLLGLSHTLFKIKNKKKIYIYI